MGERVPRDQYPWWVKVSLWGVPGRAGVWACFGLSVLAAVGCVTYAVLMNDPRLFSGLLFLFGAFMYWVTIRWVDEHGSWDPT
jgi:hypothetical protein